MLDARILHLALHAEEGGEPAAEAFWEIRGADELYDNGYAKSVRLVPSGKHAFLAKLGAIATRDSIVIVVDEITEKTILRAGGIAQFQAIYAPKRAGGRRPDVCNRRRQDGA